MRLTDYEKRVQREIDAWQREEPLLQQVLNLALQPVNWVVDRVLPDELLDAMTAALNQALGALNEASGYTYEEKDVIEAARRVGLEVYALDDLREQDLEKLDEVARSFFSQNALLAALSGGGTSLGGPLFIAADLPILFTLNFRLIQLIGGAYGFTLKEEAYRPLLLAIFNVAASGTAAAKAAAMRELSVAAAASASGGGYKGREASSTFRDQIGHLPREIAKALAGRKLAQMIPLAGIAIGAGVNYWFTDQTARTAFMLLRAMYLERKDRL